MSAPTRKPALHPRTGSSYGPTPAAPGGGADQPAPAAATRAEVHRWRPSDGPGDRPHAQPPTDPAGTPTSALDRLPEVLKVGEAAAILRVGRNQLYQAVARGELGAVRIGRTIRIPKKALADLLAHGSPRRARRDE